MMEPVLHFKIEKGFERLKIEPLVQDVHEKNFSFESCEYACRALASITALAAQDSNLEILADCLDHSACELIIDAMEKYGVESSSLAGFALQSICYLSNSSREIREFFGEMGACELVVFATSMHIGEPHISEFGSAAIYFLAKQNISNSFRLTTAGACECLAQVGNFGFNIRHDRSTVVATNVCFAFSMISEAHVFQTLIDTGAGDLVVNLLKTHFQIESLVFSAIRALCEFASLGSELREVLGQQGACEILVQAAKLYSKNTRILKEACETVMHLSLHGKNVRRLTAAGACELMVESLGPDKLLEADYGPELCSGAMLNLCKHDPSSSRTVSLRLQNAGAVACLSRAGLSSKASTRCRDNIEGLLPLLSEEYREREIAAHAAYQQQQISRLGSVELTTFSQSLDTESLSHSSSSSSSSSSAASSLLKEGYIGLGRESFQSSDSDPDEALDSFPSSPSKDNSKQRKKSPSPSAEI